MTEPRAAATRHDRILKRRLEVLVPPLMERAGIDAWVVASREYNEDPVLQTMLPATWLGTSRRRTVVVFLLQNGGVDRLTVSRYAIDDLFRAEWNPMEQPDQWAAVAVLIAEADPKRIGVNRSATFPLADGLSASESEAFIRALPEPLRPRVVSAEAAAIGWLETRLPEEVEMMAEASSIAHGYLSRALSTEVIVPGETTTEDVEWRLRSLVTADGLDVWFHPTTSVQRRSGITRDSFARRPGPAVVEGGDLLHIDFGVLWHRYCTDQQQHAYVLQPGESQAPEGLSAGVTAANRLQDLLIGAFETVRTGNEVLAIARSDAVESGIEGSFYTHPIGVHGHAAGPTIGLWDQQDGVSGQGDYPIWPNTAYSIELQARIKVDEWDGQVVQFMLEEDAFFNGDRVEWFDGRQTRLHLI